MLEQTQIMQQPWQIEQRPAQTAGYDGWLLPPVSMYLDQWKVYPQFRSDILVSASKIFVNGQLLSHPEQGFDMSAGGRFVFSFELVDQTGNAVWMEDVVYDMDPKPAPVQNPAQPETARPAQSQNSTSASKPVQNQNASGGKPASSQSSGSAAKPAQNQSSSAGKPVQNQSGAAARPAQNQSGSSQTKPAQNPNNASSQPASSQGAFAKPAQSSPKSSASTPAQNQSSPSRQEGSSQTTGKPASDPWVSEPIREQIVMIQEPVVHYVPAAQPQTSPAQLQEQVSPPKPQEQKKTDELEKQKEKDSPKEESKPEEKEEKPKKEEPQEVKEAEEPQEVKEAEEAVSLVVQAEAVWKPVVGKETMMQKRLGLVLESHMDLQQENPSVQTSLRDLHPCFLTLDQNNQHRLCLQDSLRQVRIVLDGKEWSPSWKQDAAGSRYTVIPAGSKARQLQVYTPGQDPVLVLEQMIKPCSKTALVQPLIHGVVGLLAAVWMKLIQKR